MKFNDCPECHTELSEYACSLHRVAPVLLAALKAAVNLSAPSRGVFSELPTAAIDDARAAIAKAEEGS